MQRSPAVKKWIDPLNRFLHWLDGAPLWIIGFPLIIILFSPYYILGEGSVFPIHDQLDETLMTYVLNARHLFDVPGVFPEILGGIPKNGMQPSAVLFIPLYCLLPPLYAFLVQYLIACASGFWGMYGAGKALTGSSILALAAAGCFCLLPAQPVYGLSILGVPLLLYAFLLLFRGKKLPLAYSLILFFGFSTHLILIGYVVLSFWLFYLLVCFFRKKRNVHTTRGFFLLLAVYLAVNISLVAEFLLGRGSYVSHREEMVNFSQNFLTAAVDVFLHSAQHAESLHIYLIPPILVLLAGEGIYCRIRRKQGRPEKEAEQLYHLASAIMAVLVGIALFYALCKSWPVTGLKNSLHGFLRYFQAERFYWVYPALWYLEFALAFGAFWKMGITGLLAKTGILILALLPTLNLIKVNSYFYLNVNQINNGSEVTGYISWESFYAEDLMEQLESAIGREPSQYRVAHLGMSPAPALMHGFYTVDGYSNNYPMEYKHRFRQVIAGELEKNNEARVYFDDWGSRCYLLNGVSGTYWLVGKDSGIRYENLDFDMDALKNLGCEYLFSAGQITDAEETGLDFMGYYDTEDSYWGVWLYALSEKG